MTARTPPPAVSSSAAATSAADNKIIDRVSALAKDGGRLVVSNDLFQDLIPQKSRVMVTAGPSAGFDVPGLAASAGTVKARLAWLSGWGLGVAKESDWKNARRPDRLGQMLAPSACEPFLSAFRANGLEQDGRRGKSLSELPLPLLWRRVLELAVGLQTARMRAQGQDAVPISATNYRHAWWTFAQMVAHHTLGGCNLQSGDLLGTGTLSGPTPDQAAALIELTAGGKQPIVLPNGEQRSWLEDGDMVVLRGWCERPGAARIGFGDCRGTLLPARAA